MNLIALLFFSVLAAAPVTVPEIEHRDRLASWEAGVAAADAQERVLQIVCIGDSNTEGPGYVSELRRLLQGCYGERGIGYYSLGDRAAVPEAPKITRQGAWQFLRDAPKGPPPPRFALDGIWCQTDDPAASVAVEFVLGNWAKPDSHLARAYNLQHRVRIHHQVGPDLGSFAIFVGPGELRRVDCRAERPGYAVTEPFLADGFRLAGVQGKVVLFGFDAERAAYLQGQPVLRGGVLVHALGKSWGRTEEPALVEDEAYAKFFGAMRPDLITILLGTNDQHNDGRVPAYRDWLTTMIRKLQAASPGTGILVIACPEAAQTKQGLAAQFRDAARAVAAANGAAFWDLQDLIGPRSAHWAQQGFFGDGLHYSAVGGSVIARLLLRQLGFDLNDLKHYPALRQSAATGPGERPQWTIRRLPALTLDAVAGALAGEPAQVIWANQDQLAEVRLAVAGDALAVYARVRADPAAGGNFELCVANPANISRVLHNQDGPVVRQVVFPAEGRAATVKQFTMDEKNQVVPWQSPEPVPYRLAPAAPVGYELTALIPLAQLAVTAAGRELLVEAAVYGAAAPGAKPGYYRLFAVREDGGAFRDARQFAVLRWAGGDQP